ncbi:MAG TPA: hypothetical protein VEZ90_12605 [Blastocatellia bacterium]|nr:hypothetical protein [Blastocatellia bacterium]
MPREVYIDDDIYEFIEANAQGLRETESSVLRRFLPLMGNSGVSKPRASGSVGAAANESSVVRLVTDPAFLQKSVTDRYLKILELVHNDNPSKFEKVLQVSGRSRKYFARSREEIEKSGIHTQPRPISGSGYWAMTNTDTRKKVELVRKALKVMAYVDEDIRAAEAALDGDRP